LLAIGVYRLLADDVWSTFTYPLVSVILAALAIVCVCAVVPGAVYRAVSKMTLVERL